MKETRRLFRPGIYSRKYGNLVVMQSTNKAHADPMPYTHGHSVFVAVAIIFCNHGDRVIVMIIN